MLKEDWKETDKLTYTNFNTILNKIKELYFIITNKELSLMDKSVGDFLYAEELNTVEDTILLFDASYEKKTWYNITKFDFNDVNRWCKAINKKEQSLFESKNIITEDGNQIITEDNLILKTEGV